MMMIHKIRISSWIIGDTFIVLLSNLLAKGFDYVLAPLFILHSCEPFRKCALRERKGNDGKRMGSDQPFDLWYLL